MTPTQTEPIDAFETDELELAPPPEPEPAEVVPGRPNWEPEDGDFS